MNRTIWRTIAATALLLALLGCASAPEQAASATPAPVQTPSPAPTATPAPLDGVWAVEMDGLWLELTLYADGRFTAHASERAGTVKTAAVEGIYAVRDGALHFQGGDVEYRCKAAWTDTELTIRQEGFAPLVLTRTEARP